MVFTAPFTAVPGEIITAAGWNTSARDNINHIWGVIGGNPGTSGLVPHSIGASASAWGKVTDDLLNDQKVSQAPTVVTNANSITASGLYVLNAGAAANMPFDAYWYVFDERYTTGYHWQIAGVITDNNHLWVRTIVAGTPSAWARIWTSVSDGTSSGLDADSVRTLLLGNASGNIPYNNGTLNTNLNAAMLAGLTAGNSAGQIPISNGVACATLFAAGAQTATNALALNSFVQGNGAGNIPLNNTVLNTGLNAAMLGGLSAGNASGNVPVSNGVLNANLNAALLNGIASSAFLQYPMTFLYTSVSGSLSMTTSYSAMGSVSVAVAGTYVFVASGNFYLDAVDANVYCKLDHGGVTFGQLQNIGHLESGTRPFGIVGRVVVGSVPVTVSVGGAKGGGAGGTVMEQVALFGLRIA